MSIAWSNLGLALQAENRLSEAIAAFRSAISLAPGFAQAHWNLALALLANEEFEKAGANTNGAARFQNWRA